MRPELTRRIQASVHRDRASAFGTEIGIFRSSSQVLDMNGLKEEEVIKVVGELVSAVGEGDFPADRKKVRG